jgi:hypothetical protein
MRTHLISLCSLLSLASASQLAAQSQQAVSQFFEGKQVIVKMDMPATQQGVDVYPQRPQKLDVKSYSGRLKKFGASLRNGDPVMITKVKVKDNNIEFQLGGGGYGTPMDDTDTSVHYTPSDKSGREKDLEDQLRNETDPARRRALQRRLDDARADRERRDSRDRARAEEASDYKRQTIDIRRQQGGSRFNIRFDTKQAASEVTPQTIMSALSAYVDFPAQNFGASAEPHISEELASQRTAPPPSASRPANSLKKGLTLAQVEELLGQPTETHQSSQDGLKITSYSFQTKDSNVQADFVNGVLVQYNISSR